MFPTISAILVLTVLLLAIPVDLVFALKKEDGWRGRIVVYWLFGLTHKTFRPRPQEQARAVRRRRRLRKSIASVSRQLVKKRRYLFSVMRSEGFVRRTIYLIRDLLRSLQPRRFRLQCIVGLDDPADTGRLIGVLAALRIVPGRKRTFSKHSNVAFEVTPDFTGRRCAGYWCASMRFIPLKLIGVFLVFLFSPPVFRAAKGLIQRSNA